MSNRKTKLVLMIGLPGIDLRQEGLKSRPFSMALDAITLYWTKDFDQFENLRLV
jgi:hypothetical protein